MRRSWSARSCIVFRWSSITASCSASVPPFTQQRLGVSLASGKSVASRRRSGCIQGPIQRMPESESALECLSALTCADAANLESMLNSVKIFSTVTVTNQSPTHVEPLVVRLLMICSVLRIPVKHWHTHPRLLLSLLNGVPYPFSEP